MKRKAGPDIYRILCCLGVLGYHVLDDVFSLPGVRFMYYACSFCVPGFFLLSGYLIGKKAEVSLDYSENKALGLLSKLFGWIVFWTFIHYVRTGEMYDIWDNMTKTIYSGGIEPVAWFLITFCLILVTTPFLHKILKKYPVLFTAAVLLWMLFLATEKLNWIRDAKSQSLWLHLYLGYYAAGMAIAYLEDRIVISASVLTVIEAAVFCGASAVYYWIVIVKNSPLFPHRHYGSWYYSLWLISAFCMIVRIHIKHKTIKAVLKRLSENTFSVFLGHLPVLLYVTEKHPLQSAAQAVLCIAGLFVLFQGMAEVFRRLPMLRKLV